MTWTTKPVEIHRSILIADLWHYHIFPRPCDSKAKRIHSPRQDWPLAPIKAERGKYIFPPQKKCQTKNTTNNDINSWSTLITEEQDWGPCLDPGIVVQPGIILLAKLRCTKKRAAGGWKNSTGGVSSEMSSHCHHIIIVFTVTLHICIITSWSYLSHIFVINSIQYSNRQDISVIFSTYSSYLYLLHVANKTQNQNNFIKINSHQTDISISIW